jgi:hypothetical protein
VSDRATPLRPLNTGRGGYPAAVQTEREGQTGEAASGAAPAPPLAERVAERVYELLREELRWERERRGWRNGRSQA